MKRIVDEETLKRALAALLVNAPTWESETVFEAINVEYATAIESLAEALANAPYDDLDRALEPSRAFVRGHDAGWSAAIAHTAAQVQPTACPTCGECEPRTGACGTSPDDKRASCNRDTPPPAPVQGWRLVPSQATREIEDTIGKSRNLSASEIWEDALVAAAPQPAQQEPVAGKKSHTSADNYGAAYETSDRAPFTDGDPNDGY